MTTTKPWHDAQPGDLWVLTLDGGETRVLGGEKGQGVELSPRRGFNQDRGLYRG